MSVEEKHISREENNPQDYEELAEWEILEKIKEGLKSIKNKLLKTSETSEKEVAIDEAKNELNKINEWIKWTNLKETKKEELWSAFDKLAQNLEQNINQNNLQTEFNEIMSLLEGLTQRDLASLEWDILEWDIKKKQRRNPERPTDVQKWIDESSDNLRKLSEQEDDDIVADWARRKVGEICGFLS